jgi:23S rRNA (cytosine1962-C5)-methyltransferase
MDTVVLRSGRSKPLWHGHPWVHADSVARVEEGGGEGPTDWVRVVDSEGHLVGLGFRSPASAISVRLLTRPEDGEEAAPDPLLERRIARSAALRATLFPDAARTSAYRLVHAEGDGLPGLVVDRFGDVLVAQFATQSMHRRRETLARFLLRESGARSLVARSGGFEEVEGIAPEEAHGAFGEPPPEHVEAVEEGMRLRVEPVRGQKTGHYADQRENRVRVAELAGGRTMLDLYAGTGGFAVQALRHGAVRALAVESSGRSASAAAEHARWNGVADRFEVAQEDVRARLATLRAERTRFGVVVADPPNFFPRSGPPGHALKAYRELNVQALLRVEDDGFLATFCCSARLDAPGLLDLLRAAARECRRSFRVLRTLEAGPDHPVAAVHPQGRYLSGLLVQVDG